MSLSISYTIHSVLMAELIDIIIMAQLRVSFLFSKDKSFNKRKSRIFLHIKPVTFFQKSSPLGLHCSRYTSIHY